MSVLTEYDVEFISLCRTQMDSGEWFNGDWSKEDLIETKSELEKILRKLPDNVSPEDEKFQAEEDSNFVAEQAKRKETLKEDDEESRRQMEEEFDADTDAYLNFNPSTARINIEELLTELDRALRSKD